MYCQKLGQNPESIVIWAKFDTLLHSVAPKILFVPASLEKDERAKL